MTTQIFSNNALTTLSSGIGTGDTAITVTDGSNFPSPSATEHAIVTFTEGTTVEIVKLTSRATNVLTVVRAQEGTSAQTFTADTSVIVGITADTLDRTLLNLELTSTNNVLAVKERVPSFPAAWQASTSYTGGDVIIEGSVNYRTAGGTFTSDVGIPTFNSEPGAFTPDNTSSWVCMGIDNGSTSAATQMGDQSFLLHEDASVYGAKASAERYGTSYGSLSLTGVDGTAVGWDCVAAASCISIGSSSYARGDSAGEPNICISLYVPNDIPYTRVMSGSSMQVNTTNTSWGEPLWDWTSAENWHLSENIDLTQTLADNIFTWNIPTGATFFVTEMGCIINDTDTVTVQPEISFGQAGTTESLLAQVATTKTALNGKDSFAPLTEDGYTGTITLSLKVAATATTLQGRCYIKGLLLQDEV